MKTIGDRIAQLRVENGLNSTELAKKLGINKSSVSRIENNDMKPGFDTMVSIATHFDVSLDWLAGLTTERKCTPSNEKIIAYSKKYSEIITRCENSEIDPDKLNQMIDILKK